MLVKGRVVVVEGAVGGRPRAMAVQGTDKRGRWKLKLLGGHHSGSLANQRHNVTVLVDGLPFIVTGHDGNHLRVEPVALGMRAAPPAPRRRVRTKPRQEEP